MSLKFTDVFNKTDWTKISILIIVSVGLWVWVYHEYQKPIIPPEWNQELTGEEVTAE